MDQATEIWARLESSGLAYVIASELKPGMMISIEGQVYEVLDVESKADAAKMGGVVKATLRGLYTSCLLENHFRPQERLQQLELRRHNMEFLYSSEDTSTLMDPVTFEQVEITSEMIGPAEPFLQPGMKLPVDSLRASR